MGQLSILSSAQRWSLFLLAVSLSERVCLALGASYDGYASLNVVLVSDTTVVCSAAFNGSGQDELFALDTRTGALKWRTATSRVLTKGTASVSNTFYVVTSEFLEKRSLATGKMIWSNRLDLIPQQKPQPRVTLRERAEQALQKLGLLATPATFNAVPLFGLPNAYSYTDPIITGSRIFLHREAYNHSGGCTSFRCYEDWLLMDAKTGKLAEGGDGTFLGCAGASTVIGTATGLSRIANGELREIEDYSAGGNSYWASFSPGGGESGQWSLDQHCLFERHNGGAKDLVLYDSRTERVQTLTIPATRTNHQSSWVLLDQYLLHYSQCPRWNSDASTIALSRPAFELYGRDGKFIRSSELAMESASAHWWVSFLSRTTNAVTFNTHEHSFSVEIPSLKITGRKRPATEESGALKEFRAGHITYEVSADIFIPKMASEKEVYEMSVNARDSFGERSLWKHIERVTVHRRK